MKPAAFLFALFLAAHGLAQSIKKVELSRDSGGKPGQVVAGFSPKDNPFHCLVTLKPLAAATRFTGTLIAANAAGVKNYRVASTVIGAKTGMDLVDFKFSLPRPWPTGSYRIEIQADGRALRNVEFSIK